MYIHKIRFFQLWLLENKTKGNTRANISVEGGPIAVRCLCSFSRATVGAVTAGPTVHKTIYSSKLVETTTIATAVSRRIALLLLYRRVAAAEKTSNVMLLFLLAGTSAI